MQQKALNLMHFQKKFGKEKACQKHLFRLRWPEGFRCPRGNIRGIHHGVSPKHLARYLGEFCYRFNRRFWEPQRFNRMLHACFNSATITFSELQA